MLWGAVFVFRLQDYNEYVKDYYEKCEQARRRALEEYGYHVFLAEAKSYWEWNNGGIISFFGLALLCVWITIFLNKKSLRGIESHDRNYPRTQAEE